MHSRLVCAGCSAEASPAEPLPFRCANATAEDDIDHVLQRVLDPGAVTFPVGIESNPFVRFRTLMHSWHLARHHGMTDEQYVDLVGELDARVAAVAGLGFTETPLVLQPQIAERLGCRELWIKDETGNVSGCHKARHLFGIWINLEVTERLGLSATDARQTLAIASCGNAALAAAILARAADRALEVFIPTWADPGIVAQLEELGASIVVCPRTEGVEGDPCYLAFQAAVSGGATPFCCQGPDNGMNLDGGRTLAYELLSALVNSRSRLDRLIVQVGGGALASSAVQALGEVGRMGALPMGAHRFHAVQTTGCAPLSRAHDRILAAGLVNRADEAAANRSRYMWPWEGEPHSVATGILDDETYDWHAIVSGIIATGGSPILVGDEAITEAQRLGREVAQIDVSATGAAGLAGAMQLAQDGMVHPEDSIAVIFTGARR